MINTRLRRSDGPVDQEERARHPVHEAVGRALMARLAQFPADAELFRDPACGGSHSLPLFLTEIRSNATEVCDVDLLVVRNGAIRVIMEIEEASIKPTQICGKFLTSALATCYIHDRAGTTPIGFAKAAVFIQVVDVSKLKLDRTAKRKQLERIADRLQRLLTRNDFSIDDYRLFTVNGRRDTEGIAKIADYVCEVIA